MKNEALVKEIAEKTQIPVEAVEQVLNTFTAIVIARCKKGGKGLTMINFGRFKGFDAKERTTVLVKGGKKVTPAKRLLKFYSDEDADNQLN